MTKQEIKEAIQQLPTEERTLFLRDLEMEHRFFGGTPQEKQEEINKIAERITGL